MQRKFLILPVLAALVAALSARGVGAYTLGTPTAPVLRTTASVSANQWLASNDCYAVSALVAPIPATNGYAETVASQPGATVLRLNACEAGFAVERVKPEYWLADRLTPPDNVDWNATYERFLASGSKDKFLFDNNASCVYVVSGGSVQFEWVLEGGTVQSMTYTVGAACQGRPRRIYWTDYPYNSLGVNLNGKFVKFFGDSRILTLQYGVSTNFAGGITQVTTNKVTQGLYVDPASMVLYAAGEITGQVIMAYYDSGNYDVLTAVQVVEVAKPNIVQCTGVIGEPLKPNGVGYDTTDLIARPTIGADEDERGPYLYQHQGSYSYSPKHGEVFPLRPTLGERWKAEVYWMETDAMGVQWPFEVCHYECDWPKNPMLFVRGDVNDDVGRPIFFPTDYTPELMKYQEPEAHAKNISTDGKFETTGEGYSLVKITGNDNVWFLPVHSVFRSNTNYFTLAEANLGVGSEARPRYGVDSGTTSNFVDTVDGDISGYIYAAASGTHWNHDLYREPVVDQTGTADLDTSGMTSGEVVNTNKLPSVVYPVNVPADNAGIEVWWCSAFQKADMPVPVAVPCLPQRYNVVWPDPAKTPQIVIASQQGSANESLFTQGRSLQFASTGASLPLPSRACFGEEGGALMLWTRAPAAGRGTIVTFGDDGTNRVFSVETRQNRLLVNLGGVSVEGALPVDPSEWTHLAVCWDATNVVLYVDGNRQGSAPIAPEQLAELADVLPGNVLGGNSARDSRAQVGREIAELSTWRRPFMAEELKVERYRLWTGAEVGITTYFSFRDEHDFVSGYGGLVVTERVLGTEQLGQNVVIGGEGPLALGTGVFQSDSTPKVYVQNDPAQPGYNPNEEHALVRTGNGGYVAWALRCDLNRPDTSEPGVLIQYELDGKAKMKYFAVALTNNVYPALSAPCTAGRQLPGPHPLDLFDNPWLPQTYWERYTNDVCAAGFRDRKGQLWARCAGTLPIHMFYAMQEGFNFPSLTTQPAVGTPIPWLACLDNPDANPINSNPATWTWNVSWPANVPEMRIGQTLTTAADGLPEVWAAKSMAVLYPDTTKDKNTVLLTDPTVARTVDFPHSKLALLGMRTGGNEKLTLMKGKYYFNGLPPSLSERVYLNPNGGAEGQLTLIGQKESNAGGVELLHFNVLNEAERKALIELAESDDSAESKAAKTQWEAAVAALGVEPVEPSTPAYVNSEEVKVAYQPIDHYAITAMGGTNYVTIIENDATNETMAVAAGDPISMHVFRVVDDYYTGRIVTREDPVNLLSQQLDVLYAESFAGRAGDYVFEWRRATPRPNGTLPDDYENEYTLKFEPDQCQGLTRFTIGAQGDTLANMVNTYYVMRYRAADTNCPAYAVMGDRWSGWCAPPALAEGWVQRVLNNITPFTQRMQDLYENAAETTVSMIQQAGAPYTGDVALNQDNLKDVGLVQLYETLLSKAESMSLLLGVNDGEANKQLLLAVERLADLYNVLGDEAYSDAMNPTIGFGSNFGEVEGGLGIDYGAASSSLFCFDNQVNSLLEEELALLRGRSCANAPDNTIGPCYNRLMWNFTRGITAGEVAYAVNYNITGTKSSTIDYEQAATLFPQGHGDAYGHYLSALKGWYRLLRNPYFSWGTPGMGEMVVADNVINVDYYDEAKFAASAASVAKTAADVVERTARKAWKDGSQKQVGGGYLDDDSNRAFGYGEWASRGGYGGLCNWVVANSLVPARATAQDELNTPQVDAGLTLIDRTTIGELADIASHVKAIQKTVDTADRGCNPLGFADGAVPFDITPLGASDGSNTHYEQIRARAQKAMVNAKNVLEHAQTYAGRLRMIEEAQAGYADNQDTMEQDYNNQLISIFGSPYDDDIGPAGTYPQGYDGPDLYHFMWMDYQQYGLTDMASLAVVTNITVQADKSRVTDGHVSFAFSANGLVQKPVNVTGTRRAQGEIQQAYADFIMAYAATKRTVNAYSSALDGIGEAFDDCEVAKSRAAAKLAIAETVAAGKEACLLANKMMDVSNGLIDIALDTVEGTKDVVVESIPQISGAGMTVNVDPRAMASAAVNGTTKSVKTALKEVKNANERAMKIMDGVSDSLEILKDVTEAAYDYMSEVEEAEEGLSSALSALETANVEMQTAWGKLISAQEVYNTVVAKGERILEQRELARQQAVNNITKLKYNDMFFRKLRNEALTRYDTTFDIAQRYVFLAAKAYDYETGLLASDPSAADAFYGDIIGARALGNLAADGSPLPGGVGDPGLADILHRLDANWEVLKPRLGINNPQQYATWFSLRRELFRILPGEEGDQAWRTELAKHRVENILELPEYIRFCQPLQCVDGIQEKEPGFVIPFSTTVDFARNFFGNELAGGDAAFDATYFATKIAAAGVWLDGYNGRLNGNANQDALSRTPNVYLVPVGCDCMRAPGQDTDSYLAYNVVDQTIPVPYDIGSTQLDSTDWVPFYDGFTAGVDLATRVRRHPSFRAYYGTEPSNGGLDCTRLVGRSVWNTKWLLIIPAGTLSADREAGLAAFLRGQDLDRDGKADVSGVTDIRIGFKSYANSGN